MIKADKGSVLLRGEALVLIAETKHIVHELYWKLKEFDDEMADDYLNELVEQVKMSYEEIHELAEKNRDELLDHFDSLSSMLKEMLDGVSFTADVDEVTPDVWEKIVGEDDADY